MCISKPAYERAFTLVELLVVIAIIALLGSTIIAGLTQFRTKALDAKSFAEFRQIQTALQLFYSEHGYYPDPVDYGSANIWAYSGSGSVCDPGSVGYADLDAILSPAYMPAVPYYDRCLWYSPRQNASGVWNGYVLFFIPEDPDLADPGECNSYIGGAGIGTIEYCYAEPPR